MAGDVIVTLQQEEEEEAHEKEVTTETPHINVVFLWAGGGEQEADGASEAVGRVKRMMHRRCRSLRQYDGGDLRAVLGAIAGRRRRLEGLPVDGTCSVFFVFSLRHPHLLKGVQRCQDGAAAGGQDRTVTHFI